jgi:hypothetical protein
MIGARHGRSGAGNRGGGGRVDALQPRDRPPGDGRQGGAPRRAPAPGAGLGPGQACTLAGGHGTFDPGLAAADRGAAARSVGGRAARARRGAAGADVPGAANAQRARRALRVHRDGRDRDRRDRRRPGGSAAQHDPHIRGAHDHAGAGRPGVGEPAALPAARARPIPRRGDDDRRRTRVRLERGSDEARLRRPRPGTPGHGRRLGAVHGGGIRGRSAERDECAAVAPGDSGGAGRLRDSDRGSGRARAAAAR